MKQRQTDPLHGHCLCETHAAKFSPRRTGVKFFFIPPGAVPPQLVCGRCAPQKTVRGGLMISAESLKHGIVTFLKNAAFDLSQIRATAVPLGKQQTYRRENGDIQGL